MRKIIGKEIDEIKLKDAVRAIFKAGWKKVKLYFMIGLPGETDEDLEGIIRLADEISALGREADGRAREAWISINSFIPKPHTPFQWLGMERPDSLRRKQGLIKSLAKNRKIHLDFHDIRTSVLEAAISRGGEEAGHAVHKAWMAGARLDAWTEFFDFRIWENAFNDAGASVYEQAARSFSLSDSLPWDFIDTGISKDRLADEFKRSGLRDILQ